MHHHLMRRLWLTGWIVVLFLAAGCFQPAGGGLEATSVAQALPTFTPYPTDTPSPIPIPTDTPTDNFIPTDIPTDAPTVQIIEPSTQVALLPDNQDLDPIWQTATAVFLISQGQQPIDIVPLDAPTLDPLLQQATDMVRQATETAAMPMTLTALAIQGGPIATPIFINPTFTPIPGGGGLVPSGNDCIYEVQPTDVNLYRISLLFGIPYLSIASATHMVNPNLIHVGDKLIVPGCGTTGYQPPPTTIPTNDPGYYTPNPGGGSGQTYIVVQGDTLFALSLSWGTTVNAIASLNQIPNINLIYIGQTLYIP